MEFTAIVRVFFWVSAFCTTENLSADSSWITVNVPSRPLELKTSLVPGSKAVASTPSPIGNVVTTFPVSAFTTANSLLWQPEKRRRVFGSMESPEGDSQGAKGHDATTFA